MQCSAVQWCEYPHPTPPPLCHQYCWLSAVRSYQRDPTSPSKSFSHNRVTVSKLVWHYKMFKILCTLNQHFFPLAISTACTALHCTALHCTALHCSALLCTRLAKCHLFYTTSILGWKIYPKRWLIFDITKVATYQSNLQNTITLTQNHYKTLNYTFIWTKLL